MTGHAISELFRRPDWVDRAACRGFAEQRGGEERDKVFFPARGEAVREAKAICAECPVAQECLDYALEIAVKHGIWGGLSERERRPLRKRRNAERRALAVGQ